MNREPLDGGFVALAMREYPALRRQAKHHGRIRPSTDPAMAMAIRSWPLVRTATPPLQEVSSS